MNTQMNTQKHDANYIPSIFAGVLVGGLAGAITTLLVAPQPGEKTRAQIKQKSIELRDRTVHGMDDAVASLNSNAHRITAGAHAKAEELEKYSRAMAVKQLDHVEEVVEAGKAAIKGSHKHKM